MEEHDNELVVLEVIHRYVELLDKYFGSVCELDIIFSFEKAYFMLDELLLGGEMQETSKKNVLKAIAAQDLMQEVRIVIVCWGCFVHVIQEGSEKQLLDPTAHDDCTTTARRSLQHVSHDWIHS